MTIEFHDGTNPVYKAYSKNKAWNDDGLLWLNLRYPNDRALAATNTEETIRALLEVDSVRTHFLPDYHSSLASYIDSERQSIIVVKGLHQPKLGGHWLPHVTIGLDARLFHLYFIWTRRGAFIFDHSTKGASLSDETHDGFTVVKGGKKPRRRGRP